MLVAAQLYAVDDTLTQDSGVMSKVTSQLPGLPVKGPTGLKWQNLGAAKPSRGRELDHLELQVALYDKTEFTRQEWDAFGITDLRDNDFIKTGANYFMPSSGQDLSLSLAEFEQVCVCACVCVRACVRACARACVRLICALSLSLDEFSSSSSMYPATAATTPTGGASRTPSAAYR